MKLVRKSELTAVRPHEDSELYRYEDLGLQGIGIMCSEQAPHTVREGPGPSQHVLYLISGTLDVHIEGRKDVQIGPGDALAFRPGEDRRIANNTDETAVMLIIDKRPDIAPGSRPGGPGGGPGGPGGGPEDGPGAPPEGGPGAP